MAEEGTVTQKCGYLDVKQPACVKGRKLKTWKRRWVAVTKMADLTTGTPTAKLDLFAHPPPPPQSPQGQVGRGTADRLTFVLEHVSNVRPCQSRTHPFAFEVVQDAAVLVLSGSSEEESSSWTHALCNIFFAGRRNSLATDCYSVTIYPSKDSERLGLNGTFTLCVGPEGVALMKRTRLESTDHAAFPAHHHPPATPSGSAAAAAAACVGRWTLSMLMRFRVEREPATGQPRVFLLHCGPHSPCGEAVFLFLTDEAHSILASIRKVISVAMATRQLPQPSAPPVVLVSEHHAVTMPAVTTCDTLTKLTLQDSPDFTGSTYVKVSPRSGSGSSLGSVTPRSSLSEVAPDSGRESAAEEGLLMMKGDEASIVSLAGSFNGSSHSPSISPHIGKLAVQGSSLEQQWQTERDLPWRPQQQQQHQQPYPLQQQVQGQLPQTQHEQLSHPPQERFQQQQQQQPPLPQQQIQQLNPQMGKSDSSLQLSAQQLPESMSALEQEALILGTQQQQQMQHQQKLQPPPLPPPPLRLELFKNSELQHTQQKPSRQEQQQQKQQHEQQHAQHSWQPKTPQTASSMQHCQQDSSPTAHSWCQQQQQQQQQQQEQQQEQQDQQTKKQQQEQQRQQQQQQKLQQQLLQQSDPWPSSLGEVKAMGLEDERWQPSWPVSGDPDPDPQSVSPHGGLEKHPHHQNTPPAVTDASAPEGYQASGIPPSQEDLQRASTPSVLMTDPACFRDVGLVSTVADVSANKTTPFPCVTDPSANQTRSCHVTRAETDTTANEIASWGMTTNPLAHHMKTFREEIYEPTNETKDCLCDGECACPPDHVAVCGCDSSKHHVYQSLESTRSEGDAEDRRPSTYNQGRGRRSLSLGDVSADHHYEELDARQTRKEGLGVAFSMHTVTTPPDLPARPRKEGLGEAFSMHTVTTPPDLPARPPFFHHPGVKSQHKTNTTFNMPAMELMALHHQNSEYGGEQRESILQRETHAPSSGQVVPPPLPCGEGHHYSIIEDVDLPQTRSDMSLDTASTVLQRHQNGAGVGTVATSQLSTTSRILESKQLVSDSTGLLNFNEPLEEWNNCVGSEEIVGLSQVHLESSEMAGSSRALMDFFLDDSSFHKNPMVTGELSAAVAPQGVSALSQADSGREWCEEAGRSSLRENQTGWTHFADDDTEEPGSAKCHDLWTMFQVPEAGSENGLILTSSNLSPQAQMHASKGSVGKGAGKVEGMYMDMQGQASNLVEEDSEYVSPSQLLAIDATIPSELTAESALSSHLDTEIPIPGQL